MRRKSMVLGLVIAVILGITFESTAAQKQQQKAAVQKEQPKAGGTLIFALGKEPGNPNPFIGTKSTTLFVREPSYESLLTQDDEGKIVPNLAEKYDVSSGGTAFTLRLRKGVKFHNGKEMTADDVVWSTNHVKNPKNGAFGQNIINDLKTVEKIDDSTVRFTLAKPAVTFLSNLADIRMLPIVPENSLKPGQLKLEANTYVPGTGPFILEKYQPGFDTVLKRFPEYWHGTAHLDKVIFRPITDDSNRFNALRTGDVQMADRLAPLDATRVRKGDIKGVRILEDTLGGYQSLIVNWQNPLLQKLEMRQALRYAIDKQRLVDEVFYGNAVAVDQMMDPNDMWVKTANIPRHKRDVAKAKASLNAAGYKGQELVLIGRKSEASLLESFQRMVGEAGINVKVELLEAGVRDQRFRDGKYDLYVDGGDPISDPVITMTPKYYTTKTAKGHYSNPKVDQLFDALDTEFDHKKRLMIYKDLAWMLHNDVANVPLLFTARYVGMAETVRGYGPPQGGGFSSESGDYFKNAWLK